MRKRQRRSRSSVLTEQLPVEKALGVRWNVKTDAFTFQLTINNRQNTRRGILSTVSSVYNPLGFLAPFILTAKHILKDLCKTKCSWDDIIPDAAVQRLLPRTGWMTLAACLTSVLTRLKPKSKSIQHPPSGNCPTHSNGSM